MEYFIEKNGFVRLPIIVTRFGILFATVGNRSAERPSSHVWDEHVAQSGAGAAASIATIRNERKYFSIAS